MYYKTICTQSYIKVVKMWQYCLYRVYKSLVANIIFNCNIAHISSVLNFDIYNQIIQLTEVFKIL